MWTDGLDAWYRRWGRHSLPWRLTRDPWPVLVSEVMLQQTAVARVIPRWRQFLERWPDPSACAAAPLDDVLRLWDGLGYPRRARSLHQAAQAISARGWPTDEVGLRALPGVGTYTARALLAFGFDDPEVSPPRDVNLGRVAARAGLGVEPDQVSASRLDAVLAASRRGQTSPRDHAFALFDLGATICLGRRPRCAECPLSRCASRARLSHAPPGTPPRRQAAYRGSVRELRGAILRAMLADDPPTDLEALREQVAGVAAASRPGAVEAALTALRAEGLLTR